MHQAPIDIPQGLPYDVMWEIIANTWHSALSIQERAGFMTSSSLISRQWRDIFVRIAFKDVFIPTRSYLDYYLRIIHPEQLLFRDESYRNLPNILCRSVEVELDAKTKTGEIIGELLHRIQINGTLPNLHTLVIRYKNLSDDPFDCFQFIDFPDRLENIELHFPSTKSQLHNDHEDHPAAHIHPWRLPYLRRLFISGSSLCNEHLISRYLFASPRLSVLKTDFPVKGLHPALHSKTLYWYTSFQVLM